jgi:hypothetical protein
VGGAECLKNGRTCLTRWATAMADPLTDPLSSEQKNLRSILREFEPSFCLALSPAKVALASRTTRSTSKRRGRS